MIFKRIDSEHFNSSHKTATAKVSFYGKPFKVQILSKGIVRYNAGLVSKQLELKNGKYAIVIKKLIDSCIANGIQKGLNPEKMYIKTLSVARGKYLKRIEFKGRGRRGTVWRAHSNANVEIEEVGE